MSVIETEKPYGVVVAFGGQTAIKLTKASGSSGASTMLGTSADSIDMAEDRERFDAAAGEAAHQPAPGHHRHDRGGGA